jgi:hypothetical protein
VFRRRGEAVPVLAFILLLVLVWVVLGLIGFVVKGLFWLFLIACVLFLITLIFGATRARSRS